MNHDTTAATTADELIDAELGWALVAQHDKQDHHDGYLDYPHLNDAMAYSDAYMAGWEQARSEDSLDNQPGYTESTRPYWF